MAAAVNAPIGFIGLGHMGGAMALRLLAAGFPLLVHDPVAAACARVADHGARVAASARAVADEARIVFLCLPHAVASRAAACGENGLIGGAALRCVVETSTIGRTAVRELAEVLGAADVDLVDAPVSGGPKSVAGGTLTMMMAGRADRLAEIRPVIDALAGRVFVVGDEPGLGQMVKIVNNAISLVGMVLACEATVVGVRAGLDARVMLDVINSSTGRNSATAEKFPRAILTRSFDYGGAIETGPKDLDLFLDEAKAFGIPTTVAAAGTELWRTAVADGDPRRDFTRVIQTLERWAGVEVDGRATTGIAGEETDG